MKLKTLAWVSTLTLIILGAGGAVLHASGSDGAARWHQAAAGHDKSAWHHGRGGPMAHLCASTGEAPWQRLVAVVDSFADFDDRQQAAWESLSAAMQEAGESVRGRCDAIRDQGRPSTAPERLTRMETMTAAVADALRIVRPPFEAFYDTLDADQQAALDGIMTHRRGMRHRRSGNAETSS
jgi:hypothetical protein